MRVRAMTADDVERVAALCGQLGYPSTPAEVAARFEVLRTRTAHAMFVAEDPASVASAPGPVVGFVHVHEAVTLEAGPWAEIGGLVVREGMRSDGIGRLLVDAAERWAAEHGYAEVHVRSNVVREAAHQFYLHLGYEVVKSQLNFRKPLGARGAR